MKFIVQSAELLQHLLKVNGAIVSKPVLPILENFLFDIKGGVLTISATDLETSMTTSMSVDSKEDIQVAVPSKIIIDYLRNLPEQPVTFTVDEEHFSIEVTTGVGRYKMPGQSGIDFPLTPAVEGDSSFNMPCNLLLRSISKTLFATGSDELRIALTGVYVELGNESITFVATDANKLVRFTRNDVKPGAENHFIIPKKALNLLRSSINNDDSPVTIEWNKSNVFFTYDKTRLICRLIDERYPDYKAVIPSGNDKILSVRRMDLLSTLRRIGIFASKTTHQVRLKIAGSDLQVGAEDIEMANEAQERLACDYDGEDLEIGFNGRFLIDMLGNVDSDSVEIRLAAPSKAGLVMPGEQEKDEDMLMLIMPMMLNNY
jgi:DNA polymerase-3 subunit beta